MPYFVDFLDLSVVMEVISSPFSDVSDREWNDLSSLIMTVKVSWNHHEVNVQQTCCKTLGKIWNLSDQPRYKLPLTHPSLKLLPLFKKILLESNHPTIRTYVLRCIWYLSRHVANYSIIGAKELGLLEILMDLLRREDDDACYKILRNCSFDSKVHDYLFSDKIGYLEFYKNEAITDPVSIYPYHVFAAAGGTVQEDCVHYFLKWRIPELVFYRLAEAGTDPVLWLGREFGIEDHGLSFISSLSSIPASKTALYNCNLFDFLDGVVYEDSTGESYRTLIVLINLYGDDDSNSNQKEKIMRHIENNQAIKTFFVMGMAIIDHTGPAAMEMQQAGIQYGAVMLRDVLLAFYNISLLGSIEWHILLLSVGERGLIPLLIETIEGFFLNKPFHAPNDVGQIYAGGGVADELSLVYALRLLLRLCQFECDQRDLMEQYHRLLVSSMVTLNLIHKLEQLGNDSKKYKDRLITLFRLVKTEVKGIIHNNSS